MGVLEAKKATTQIARLAQNLQTRLLAHDAFTDPDLTSEARQRRREERVAASLTDARRKAAAILKTAQDGAAFADRQLDAYRPKLDPNDVAQLTRTAQAWQMTIEPLRAQGKNWAEIAAVTDADGLLALERFAPQTIRLQESARDAEIIMANLQRASDRRLAEIHTDEPARQRFVDAADAQKYLGAVSAIASGIEGVTKPTDATAVMISVKRNIHPLGTLPTEPPATSEQLDRTLSAATHGGMGAHELAASVPA
ncbi:hypothetical protein [Agromyces humatus]|uniref:DUF222 domain-containing protein n=1 Tax=Agromyces humatus TaxID=279573 RepID=A0ABP4X628_9MICO|nr:hypothetical protein [Agromyces humatus]